MFPHPTDLSVPSFLDPHLLPFVIPCAIPSPHSVFTSYIYQKRYVLSASTDTQAVRRI